MNWRTARGVHSCRNVRNSRRGYPFPRSPACRRFFPIRKSSWDRIAFARVRSAIKPVRFSTSLNSRTPAIVINRAFEKVREIHLVTLCSGRLRLGF